MLAKGLAEMLDTTPSHMSRLRLLIPSTPGEPHYVFVLFPVPKHFSYHDYRSARQSYLDAACRVLRHLHQDALDSVGVASESGVDDPKRSEDALYLGARVRTPEMDAEAVTLRSDLRILTKPSEIRGVEKEYPDPAPTEVSPG